MVKDFDPLGIVVMIKEVYIFFDQFDGGFVDSAVKGDGSVAVDFSSGTDAEEVRKISWGRPQKVKVAGVTIPGCLLGGAMGGSMIGLIAPLFEPFVEVGQR